MPPEELQEGELLLAEVEALHHAGVLAYPGRLRLTDRRIWFTPKGSYRLLGARSAEVPVAEVESVSSEGVDRLVRVNLRGDDQNKPLVLSGPGARVVQERLSAMLTEEEDSSAEFLAQERILVACSGQRRVGKWMASSGEVLITTERIRFRVSGVSRMVFGGSSFDCRIKDVQQLSLTGARRVLGITTSTDHYRLMAGQLGEIHGAIRAVQDHLLSGGNLMSLQVDRERALLHRGALATRGDATFTDRRVSFVPDALDRVASGAERVEVRLDNLITLQLTRTRNPRLRLSTAEKSIELSFEGQDARFDLMARRMAASPGPAEHSITGDYSEPESVKVAVFALWASRLPSNLDATSIFDPTVFVNSRGRAQPGWLAVSDRQAVWIPCRRPESGDDIVTLPLAQVERSQIKDPDDVGIRARIDGADIIFYPRAGAPRCREFWRLVDERLAALAKGDEDSGLHSLNRRETYRVKTFARDRTIIEARISNGVEEPIETEVSLLDMSMGGCAVQSVLQVPEGSKLELAIPQAESTRWIEAEVVYERPASGNEGWRLGLRFMPEDQAELEYLRSSWMEMQREIASQRVI